jgi:hypothetical protein
MRHHNGHNHGNRNDLRELPSNKHANPNSDKHASIFDHADPKHPHEHAHDYPYDDNKHRNGK